MKKRKLPILPVGLFLLAGLSILGWMVINYGGTGPKQESVKFTVEFDDASGIIQGGVVRLAGANVGTITSTPVLNPQLRVDIELEVSKELQLPDNVQFKIVPLSMLGDKAIYILYPEVPSSTIIQDGDRFIGVSPKSLDQLQVQAEELTERANRVLDLTESTFTAVHNTLTEFQTAATSLNTAITRLNASVLSEESLGHLSGSIKSINTTSDELAEFSKELSPLAEDTRRTMATFSTVATKTDGLITEAQTLISTTNSRMEEISPALKTLPATLQTYQKVGDSLNKALSSDDSLVSALTQDNEVKTDAKTFVKNLKNNGILGYKDNSDPDSDDPRDRYRGMRR